MPELRRNILTGEWVAIAEERAKRPGNLKGTGLQRGGDDQCPFCPGNEYMTPAECYRSQDGRVRVIPNKYPMLTKESEAGFGIHEVLIDTDIHHEGLHQFSTEQIMNVFTAIQARIRFLKKNGRVQYIQVFKNNGAHAGASQAHSHWQLVAMPIFPLMQERMLMNAGSYQEAHGQCYLCGQRMREASFCDIYENSGCKAYCEYASKFSYEIHIAPKRHTAWFESIEGAVLSDMAEALQKCLGALYGLFPKLEYNICFMGSCVNRPEEVTAEKCMHFYIEIIPRRGFLAGLELSTASYINPVPPETAARHLREKIRAMDGELL